MRFAAIGQPGRSGARVAMLLAALAMIGAASQPASADDLDAILASKTLRAGVCLTSEPIGFRDAQNVPRGYDVDVAHRMADALGVKLDLVEATPTTRIAMLTGGRIDVVICAMTATLERARTIDFSLPYLKTGIRLLVRKDSGIRGFDDLGTGRTIAMSRGTTGAALAAERAPAANTAYVDNPGDAVLLLRAGKADAYVEDGLIIDHLARSYADQLTALPETYTSDSIAFGVRRNNPEWLRWLDLFASLYVSSGAYAKTYAKWWGEPVPAITPVW